MASINLLPTNLAPKGSIVRLTDILKNVIVVGIILLFVGGLGALALVLLDYFQSQSITKRSELLKASITSLEQTEAKFVLVKNRVERAKEIFSQDEAQRRLDNLSRLTSSLPSDMLVSEVEVGRDKFSLTFSTSNSATLAVFMSGVVADSAFEKIDLTDFSFVPTSGYRVTLSFF